ncbi:MAG TPA: sugar kinase [Chloroflexota bacterium]|nr:sugar kinase [Chloroflexota bacterium]
MTQPDASPDLVTLGETMVLFLAEQAGPLREAVTFRRHIGGAEANVAVGLCRLGHTAGWISRVGQDDLGQAILFRLRGEGVDLTQTRVDAEAPTGVMFRERREVGPINVAYYRGGSAASRLSPADLDEAYIRGARVLHLTGITPALSASCRAATFAAAEIARAAGVTIVLDPNLRLKLWSLDEARATLRELVARADIVLPGADEAEMLTGTADPEAAARALLALGPTAVVVKTGAQGCLAVTTTGVTHAQATPVARVVDPVGAGDAFAAGFHAGRLRGMSLHDTLLLANRCGAAAMTVDGDMEGFPSWADVASATAAAPLRDVQR